MKSICLSFFCAFGFFFTALNSSTAQKQVKETALVYNLSLIKPNVPQGNVNNKDAELKIWIKPDQSRSETIYEIGKETAIFNQENNKGVILKAFRGQELLILLSGENWMEKNALFQQAKFTITDSLQKINGMLCRRAVASVTGGKITVYFNPDMLLANTKYDLAFPDLKGLPVKVEWVGSSNASTAMVFTLKQIDFDNIPQSKFDFPATEKYKTIGFEEAKKGSKIN